MDADALFRFDRARLALLGCGVFYAVLAVLAARAEYPGPEKIAVVRFQGAVAMAQAADGSFTVASLPLAPDVNANYENLRRIFTERFGQAFNPSHLDAAYLESLRTLEADRLRLVVFTAVSILAVFALLHAVWWYAWRRGEVGPGRS